jgi:hypothetical protein
MKALCDRLEQAQDKPGEYHRIVVKIRAEAEALRHSVCVDGAGGVQE